MPRHVVPWPQWMREEDIIAAWFLSRGLETRDVADIMTHRLHRQPRTLTAFITRMEQLNSDLARRGYPELCTKGMFDWDKHAVDDFLIRSTNDRRLLNDLLWFDGGDTWLLNEVSPTSHFHPLARPLLIAPCLQYRKLRVPLHEVFSVDGMQYELDEFLRKHRMFWGPPPPRRSGRFY